MVALARGTGEPPRRRAWLRRRGNTSVASIWAISTPRRQRAPGIEQQLAFLHLHPPEDRAKLLVGLAHVVPTHPWIAVRGGGDGGDQRSRPRPVPRRWLSPNRGRLKLLLPGELRQPSVEGRATVVPAVQRVIPEPPAVARPQPGPRLLLSPLENRHRWPVTSAGSHRMEDLSLLNLASLRNCLQGHSSPPQGRRIPRMISDNTGLPRRNAPRPGHRWLIRVGAFKRAQAPAICNAFAPRVGHSCIQGFSSGPGCPGDAGASRQHV